jgi:hypothetical protein
MNRISVLAILLASVGLILAGCGGDAEEEEAAAADAATRPTQMTATNASNLQEAVGPDGAWIIIFEDDLASSQEVVISGEVYEEEGAEEPRRKLALYTQDADRNVTARYTLTVPRLVVDHMNTRIQAGEVAGNVFVQAEGFELTSGATINGNLYFETQALRDSATIDDSATVLGEIRIGGVDAVTRPTEATVTQPGNLRQALGPEGPWIILFEGDLQVGDDVMVFGAVYEEDGAEAPRRKLALYAQDADRNVTARYTLTVPRMIVHHMNTRIQAGTIAGDVYVEEEGFELTSGGTIDGALYFASEELRDSATIDDSSTVTGGISIGTAD